MSLNLVLRRFTVAFGILAIASHGFAQLGNGITTGANSSSFGRTTDSGNSGFGQSSFGNSSFGQSNFGSGATGQNSSQGFVGRSSADIESFFGSVGQVVQEVQRQQRSRRQATNQSSEFRRPPVRVALTASPELLQQIPPQQSAFSQRALMRTARHLQQRGLDRVRISQTAGEITLTGVVSSLSESRLAQTLFSIEPGVDRVVNHLQIQSPPEELPALPADN